MTQEALAAKIGVSRASIANIESGRQKVLVHTLYELAAALQLHGVHDLLPEYAEVETKSAPLSLSGAQVSDKQRVQVELAMMKALGTRGAR
ncbi:MAG: helix-turn-helix domain-containing protein [Caulobacterales bacterium]|nr:helix-turn-helix domain-containing protein [Caulobacterales bacterium]